MKDLDTALRSVARDLVSGASPPPPFPRSTARAVAPTGWPVRRLALAGAGAAALAGIATAALVVARDEPTRIDASDQDHPTTPAPARRSPACNVDPGLRVTVPDATQGPTEGAAPRASSLDDGQRALHWMTAEGSVELRWPARSQPLYDDGTAVVSTLAAGESVSAGRSEIDVAPAPSASDPATMFDPDVVIESQDRAAPAPSAPCDLLELTVVTEEGRWHGGLRALPPGGELGAPSERVDLQPRIIERRAVEVAPHAAVRCQGSDDNGTPPNRTGGADRSIGGSQPADVLLDYLSVSPGAPPSGYVEMREPDGSITYAVDPSGIGWTMLLFAARDGDTWYLEGWTSSGC